MRENEVIIPAGRQVWIDKCHVCYCPSSLDINVNINIDRNNIAYQKHPSSPRKVLHKHERIHAKDNRTDKKDVQHALCVFKKSYACTET